MLVSVVIPAFNAEQWIAETILSVLRQTHDEIEIIVVDDGSSDRTAEIAAQTLLNARFPYKLLQQQNQGAAKARNLGWRIAKADWIQFLDADDLLEPRKIELQAKVACGDNGSAVIYSDWQKLVLVDEKWTPFDARSPMIRGDGVADILSDRNFLQLGCMLFRKKILECVGGFDSSHEPIEDVGLYVKIAISKGVFVKAPSDHPLSFYRDLPDSLSKTNPRRFIESCVKNAKLAERFLRALGPTDEKVDAIVDVYHAAARYFAVEDSARFEELVNDIDKLRPEFLPKTPQRLRVLSRMVGYRRAERLAVLYGKCKRALNAASPHPTQRI